MEATCKDNYVYIETKKPVAIDSPDHLCPLGTAQDNSTNWYFNQKLYTLFGKRIKVLDLGCSGGGFVRNCINDGHFAVGLEGSDYSLKMLRAEWPILGNKFLFTADITAPFNLQFVCGQTDTHLNFDVITLWEVCEHIAEEDIEGLVKNIFNHLAPGGIIIASIGEGACDSGDGEVVWHQTVKSKNWWIEKFQQFGLNHRPELLDYFDGQYIRGPKQGYTTPDSFHVILQRESEALPIIPPTTLKARILRKWFGSAPHRLLKILLGMNPDIYP